MWQWQRPLIAAVAIIGKDESGYASRRKERAIEI